MPNPMHATGKTSRPFRPRAVPTLAAIVAVAVFVAGGRWQQGRMHAMEALRTQFDATAVLAPVALATLPGSGDWSALRYRTVIATGEYVARRQVLVDNRVHDGHAGYHVVTPLVQADGRTVLVNRGWTPQGASRAALPRVDPPAGLVTVRGRIAMPAAGAFELRKETASGPVWQNLDPARFTVATGIVVIPIMIEATTAPSPDDGLVRDWPAPDFGIEKHRIYMVQWYSFAALAIVLWVVLNLRRARTPSDE